MSREALTRLAIALEVNGERVGTLSARITKPASEIGYSLTNPGELVEWLRSGEGYAVLTEVVKKQWKAIAKASVDMDGEVPPGIDASTYSVPARWDGTTLRVDVAKVRDALGTGLPAAVAGVINALFPLGAELGAVCRLSWAHAGGTIGVVLALSLLAALPPSLSCSRLSPSEVIRNE